MLFSLLKKGPEGDKNFEMCLSRPEDFVLKPQREGGGTSQYPEWRGKLLGGHVIVVVPLAMKDLGFFPEKV